MKSRDEVLDEIRDPERFKKEAEKEKKIKLIELKAVIARAILNEISGNNKANSIDEVVEEIYLMFNEEDSLQKGMKAMNNIRDSNKL